MQDCDAGMTMGTANPIVLSVQQMAHLCYFLLDSAERILSHAVA